MESFKLISVLNVDDQLNNVLVPLSLDIDEVFYIYHHYIDKQFINVVKNIITKYKDIKVNFICSKDDNKEIDNILKKHNKYYVDVGAAKYLSLVLFEKTVNTQHELIYYDAIVGKIKSYRSRAYVANKIFKLSIEDLLNLGGGKIVEHMHTTIDENDPLSLEIINRSLESSIYSYSKFTTFVQKINSLISRDKPNSGRIYYLREDTKRKIETDESYRKYKELGLLKIEKDKLIFPTNNIAKLFSVSGTFLENYIYNKLVESKKFDDVKMSCVIDFSGKFRKYPVVCEIDCLVVKDNHLLFVSCKSNKVDTGDLNEIKVHNTMFGNKLSSPVLCTLDDLNMKSPSVYSKARELNVAIIDNTAFDENIVPELFEKIIKNKYSYERVK